MISSARLLARGGWYRTSTTDMAFNAAHDCGCVSVITSCWVDLARAKEHHSLWLEQEGARSGPNEIQRQPIGTSPAE
jgi:hypothetical protein